MDESHAKIRLLGECCERFVRSCLRDIRDRGTWFVVAGQTGCGKTHCAKAVARYYWAHHVDAWSRGWFGATTHLPGPVFIHWPTICEIEARDFNEWFRTDMTSSRLVVVDDFGAEADRYRGGENEGRLLRVLEACDEKWFFGTTNLARSQWAHRYDQRISDRLMAGRYVGLFDVPSFRVNANAKEAR